MTQPISTVRSAIGPLTATALEVDTVEIIRAVGRARSAIHTITGFGQLSVWEWTPIFQSGCQWDSRLTVDYAGAWDVHAIVSAYPNDDPPVAGSYIQTRFVSYAADSEILVDATLHANEAFQDTSLGVAVRATPSSPIYVPTVGGAISIEVYNSAEVSIDVEIEMSAHYICPAIYVVPGST